MIGAAVLTASQIVLGMTFALSAGGKAFNSRPFEDGLAGAGVRLRLIAPATAAVVGLETSLSFAIVLARDEWLGLTLAIASITLAIFTSWLILLYRSHSGLACGCFGSASDTIGVRSLARNILLMSCSVGGLLLWSAGDSTWLPPISGTSVAIDLGIALILLLLASGIGARPYLAWSQGSRGSLGRTDRDPAGGI
jgi:hypothetical protein